MHFPVEEDDDGSSPFGPAKPISDFRFWILDSKSPMKTWNHIQVRTSYDNVLQKETKRMFTRKSRPFTAT